MAANNFNNGNAGSDSDDLEDTPEFIKSSKAERGKTYELSAQSTQEVTERSKLDILLSEHREQQKEKEEEDYFKQIVEAGAEVKEEVPTYRTEVLTENSTEFIQQMDTSTCVKQEGLNIFNTEELHFLFTENLTLLDCGFKPSSAPFDKILASISPHTLSTVLMSKALITCLRDNPQAGIVKTWLFYIMSIHLSPTVRQFCFVNLMSLIQQSKVQALSPEEAPSEQIWCPSAADLLKVLVNWGANPNVLLGEQTVYSPIEISDHLTSLMSPAVDKRDSQMDLQLCRNNLSCVLKVLSAALQQRPKIQCGELDLMMCMLVQTSLDVTLQGSLDREHQVCFSSLLECYPRDQWPDMVPKLSCFLGGVSEAHRDHVHLAELFTSGGRAEELQVSVSFLLMCKSLCPDAKPLSDNQLKQVELVDITWLGETPDPSAQSCLAVSLNQMVATDLPRMASVLQLLELCVGSEHRRAAKPRDQLEYLVDQVKNVIKGIRDNIYKEDQSKIKDALSRMKVKWSLTLQNRKSVQRSIFSWATSNQQTITEHVLQDRKVLSSDMDDEGLG